MARDSRNSKATARSLAELTAGLVDVPAGIVVTDVTLDSREASPGALFLDTMHANDPGRDLIAGILARELRTQGVLAALTPRS